MIFSVMVDPIRPPAISLGMCLLGEPLCRRRLSTEKRIM
jgi:hypothetical protein